MKSGDLRDRVRFERKADYSEGYANASTSWSTIATVSAGIAPLSGDEKVIAGQMFEEANAKISVRDTSVFDGLTTKDRAVNIRTGTIYDLLHIDRVTSRGSLIIKAMSTGALALFVGLTPISGSARATLADVSLEGSGDASAGIVGELAPGALDGIGFEGAGSVTIVGAGSASLADMVGQGAAAAMQMPPF